MVWTVETLDQIVDEELEALPSDMRARFVWVSQLIEIHGLQNVREPYIKHVEDVLWEIRMKGKDGISRALYATVKPERVVVVRVFVKKTQKTPPKEIAKAEEIRKDVRI